MRCRSEASVVCCRLCGFTRVCALWPQTYAHCSHVLVSVYYIELCIGFASTAVYYSASMCSLDGGGVYWTRSSHSEAVVASFGWHITKLAATALTLRGQSKKQNGNFVM